jgi:uncharacterized membrane protein
MDKLKAAELKLKHRSNQRKIWVALAVAVTCFSAMLLHRTWYYYDTDPMRLVVYFALVAVGIGAAWYTGKLAKENQAIQRQLSEEDP